MRRPLALLLPPRLLRRFTAARARAADALLLPNLQRTAAGSLRWRLQRDLQHAVAEGRARRRRVRTLGQGYRPVEAAVASLASVIALLSAGLIIPALALQGYGVLVDFHLDVFLLDSRQVGRHDQLAIALEHFQMRRPKRRTRFGARGESARPSKVAATQGAAPQTESLEQAVHFIADAAHDRERAAAVGSVIRPRGRLRAAA